MVEILLCSTLLDMTYSNTVDFSNYKNQYNYFRNRGKTHIVNINSKIDGFVESITIKAPIQDIQKYDYCVIKSKDKLNDRWFYFFITEVRQVTKADTLIALKCDVFQTYMFNYSLGQSFVERCHVNRWNEDMSPTENNLDEALEYGSLIIDEIKKVTTLEDNYVICSTSPLGTIPKGSGNGGYETDYDSSHPDNGMGNPSSGKVSNKFVRFIKGYEGFSSVQYYDSGGVLTIGYGTTKSDSSGWNTLVSKEPCTEKDATIVLIDRLNNNYAKDLANRMKSDGVDLSVLPYNKFDAFCDLCYNGGLGAVTKSPMYQKFVQGKSDSEIVEGWESWYIRDDAGNQLQGLIYRRKAEKDIFLNAKYGNRAIQNLNGGGYVEGNGYLPSTDTESRGQKIINSAKKLLGKPYRWGGNYPPIGSNDGTDCSGLCQWAYNDNGIKITRTTYTQIKEGKEITDIKNGLKSGDLIFMYFSATNTPEHVVLFSHYTSEGKLATVEAQKTGTLIHERDFSITGEMRARRIL